MRVDSSGGMHPLGRHMVERPPRRTRLAVGPKELTIHEGSQAHAEPGRVVRAHTVLDGSVGRPVFAPA